MRLELPPDLEGVFFDFVWDKARVWQLPTVAETLPIAELMWHMDLPIWSTVMGEPRFDLAPAMVLAEPTRYDAHWQRIQRANINFALDLFRNGTRWVILDGYHRLARHVVLGRTTALCRRHSDLYLDWIKQA